MTSIPLGCCVRVPRFSKLLSAKRVTATPGDGIRSARVLSETHNAASRAEETEDGASLLPLLFQQETLDCSDLVQRNRNLWKAAVKLPMCWVAVVPVMVGAATTYYETGILPLGPVMQLLIGSISVIAWLNLSNDVFDHDMNADEMKPESVMKLVGNRPFLFQLSLAFLAAGLALLGSVIWAKGAQPAAAMLGLAIACGYIYQGPPFRLSYKGLGEPLCFVAFGPLATSAFYLLLSHTASISATCWAASILVGFTTTVVLFCSHFHQYESDKAVNKMSPVVRLGGADKAFKVLSGSVPCLFSLLAALSAMRLLPWSLLLMSILPAILGVRCVKYGGEHLRDLSRLRFLKLYALDLHAGMGFALVLALSLSRRFLLFQ